MAIDVLGGLDHVAGARQEEGLVLVGDEEQGLELAQHLVGPPVLGELDRGARQVALVFLELRLEVLEQGEGVGGRAGEADQDLAVVDRPHLAGVALHHGLAHGHLAVAGHGHLAVAAHRDDGRAS